MLKSQVLTEIQKTKILAQLNERNEVFLDVCIDLLSRHAKIYEKNHLTHYVRIFLKLNFPDLFQEDRDGYWLAENKEDTQSIPIVGSCAQEQG